MYATAPQYPLPQQRAPAHPPVRGRAGDPARRAVDLVVAAIALIVSLPVCLIIAAAIKLSSPGPIFYSQLRVGLDRRGTAPVPGDRRRRHDAGGRPFRIYKFRTMTADAERATGAVWARDDDPRVTAVGRLLRQLHLDELPQLLNVLRGDMAIVGPRPERPGIFAALAERIPDYAARQRTLPGITGWAQIHLAYDQTVDDVAAKLEYDLAYLRARSVTTDLRIMAMTVPFLFFRHRLPHHVAPALHPLALKR